jgi:hypothetical protein
MSLLKIFSIGKKPKVSNATPLAKPRNTKTSDCARNLMLYHLTNRMLLEETVAEKGRLEYSTTPIFLSLDKNKAERGPRVTNYKGCEDLCLIEVTLGDASLIPEIRKSLDGSFFVPYLEPEMLSINREFEERKDSLSRNKN